MKSPTELVNMVRDANIVSVGIAMEFVRQELMADLKFQIDLLSDAEKMNDYKMLMVGDSFLGWSQDHTRELQKLRELEQYLENNQGQWDIKYYFEVINSIQKDGIQTDTKTITT